MKRQFAVAVALVAPWFIAPSYASAQRFEGIITMKWSGGVNMLMGGGRGGARGGGMPADVDGGRGARGSSPARGGSADARGGTGRGGAGGRAAAGAGEPSSDPREQAMRNAMSGNLQQIEYMTRRGKIRIAIGTGGGTAPAAAMVYVPDEGIVYTLLPAASMYSEMSMADIAARTQSDTASARASRRTPRPPVVIHTKNFELIAGHRCEHVLITQGAAKTDVCMGKGLGAFVMPMMSGNDAWNQVMTEANGFPLKVVDGAGRTVVEVVRIERKALPEALFGVPDSYTKMPTFGRPPV